MIRQGWNVEVRRAVLVDTPKPQRREHAPEPGDRANIITGSTVLIDDDGHVIAAQLVEHDEQTRRLYDRLVTQEYWEGWAPNKALGTNEVRLGGINNRNVTFGFSPPQVLRRRYGCSACLYNQRCPGTCKLLGVLANRATDRLVDLGLFPEHETAMSGIHPDWRFAGSGYTSGIINDTAGLPYHKDSGNIAGTISSMYVARHGVDGGLLHVPELDVWFACPTGAWVIFDGQRLWHGVTPMLRQPGGHRFTVVFYVKAGIRRCGPAADEPARAAAYATSLAEGKLHA